MHVYGQIFESWKPCSKSTNARLLLIFGVENEATNMHSKIVDEISDVRREWVSLTN